MGLHGLLLLLHGGHTLSVQFQIHPSCWVLIKSNGSRHLQRSLRLILVLQSQKKNGASFYPEFQILGRADEGLLQETVQHKS
jgi:hypothetical protein